MRAAAALLRPCLYHFAPIIAARPVIMQSERRFGVRSRLSLDLVASTISASEGAVSFFIIIV